MAKKKTAASEGLNEILLYTTPNGKVKVEVYLHNETIWLTQQKIADLFGVNRTVITKHISNIYSENELNKVAICAKNAQVQIEGQRKVHSIHSDNMFRSGELNEQLVGANFAHTTQNEDRNSRLVPVSL